MIIAHLNQNIVKRLFFEGDSQLLKGNFIILQVFQNLQKLVRKVIYEICDNLASEYQFVSAVIRFNNTTKALIKFLRLDLVGAPVTGNGFSQKFKQCIEFRNR